MKKGGKKKCLWGFTVRKLTRTQYGNSRETADERKADGISSQQILGLFSCLNALIWSEECAVCPLFFRDVLAVISSRGSKWICMVRAGLLRCVQEGWGLHGTGHRMPAQGISAFLPGQAQSHRAQMCCGVLVLGAWITHPLPSLETVRNLSGNPGKGSGVLQELQTQLRRRIQFPLSKGLKPERNVWSNGGTPSSPQTLHGECQIFFFSTLWGFFQSWVCLVRSCHTLGVEGIAAQHSEWKQKQN